MCNPPLPWKDQKHSLENQCLEPPDPAASHPSFRSEFLETKCGCLQSLPGVRVLQESRSLAIACGLGFGASHNGDAQSIPRWIRKDAKSLYASTRIGPKVGGVKRAIFPTAKVPNMGKYGVILDDQGWQHRLLNKGVGWCLDWTNKIDHY